MHDQCHRLNNLVLTFLANFLKKKRIIIITKSEQVQEKGEFFFFQKKKKIHCVLQWEFYLCTHKQKSWYMQNFFVCEVCGHAFRSWRISEDLGNAETNQLMKEKGRGTVGVSKILKTIKYCMKNEGQVNGIVNAPVLSNGLSLC